MRTLEKIVVKVGSNLLVENRALSKRFIIELCGQISGLFREGFRVALVTSGARAAALALLGRPEGNRLEKQALCAIGQVQVMKTYEAAFEFHGLKVAQLLVTRDDFSNRKRFLNLRNTLLGLQSMDVIPIINENDTVSTEEIQLGDNDVLSAMFAMGWGADKLVLMTSAEGVYDRAGKVIPDFQGHEELLHMKKTSSGTGGIFTKVLAARIASNTGVDVCICSGKRMENLPLFSRQGKTTGTVFHARQNVPGKRAWLAYLSKEKGCLWINEGARLALLKRKSLLPVGVEKVEGRFSRGDTVRIVSQPGGKPVGRGIVNYRWDHAAKIAGKTSAEAERILEDFAYEELVHADNLVLLQKDILTGFDVPARDSDRKT